MGEFWVRELSQTQDSTIDWGLDLGIGNENVCVKHSAFWWFYYVHILFYATFQCFSDNFRFPSRLKVGATATVTMNKVSNNKCKVPTIKCILIFSILIFTQLAIYCSILVLCLFEHRYLGKHNISESIQYTRLKFA